MTKDRNTETQKDRKTEGQRDRKTERQKGRKRKREKGRKRKREKDRKTERQKDHPINGRKLDLVLFNPKSHYVMRSEWSIKIWQNMFILVMSCQHFTFRSSLSSHNDGCWKQWALSSTPRCTPPQGGLSRRLASTRI